MVIPESIEEIASILSEARDTVNFHMRPQPHPFAIFGPGMAGAVGISLSSYTGIIEHDVSDQVVVVRAGTSLNELQAELAKVGQCLPLPRFDPACELATASIHEPLIDKIAFNLPHGLHSQCGSWRDWIIGMRIVQSDGTIAKCGSKAVKNVAGFDVQKLMIGARNSLGLIADVTFKTFPLEALPVPEVQFSTTMIGRSPNWIHRVLPTDFAAALRSHGLRVIAFDKPSSTMWVEAGPNENLRRFKGDWVLRAGCGKRNLEFTDPTVIQLMKRTKELFDPSHKLNPGAMGIF